MTIGRYQIVLEREEWVQDQGGRELRIYFHSGLAVDGGRVESFLLEAVNEYSSAYTDGGDGYLQLPDPRPGHTTLHITNPIIRIDGPWVLPLTTS